MNWDYTTFIPLLYEACRMTDGAVVELGVGLCSTPLLHSLVTYGAEPRDLFSVDDDESWLGVLRSRFIDEKHTYIHVTDWVKCLEVVATNPISVAFVDCGAIDDIPFAKRLRFNMVRLFCNAEIIVVHDYSNISSQDNEFNRYIHENFKFRCVDDHTKPSTIWLSNKNSPEFTFQRNLF